MRSGGITIRPVTPADREELFRLNALFNGASATTPARMAHFLAKPGDEVVIVADTGTGLAGLCCGRVLCSVCYAEPSGELTELFVEENSRRKGVARRLLAAMEAELLARGAQSLYLLTGQKNSSARALYESLGYTGKDEVMYKK
jgi:GNAT superfamily N-acetyltransferase